MTTLLLYHAKNTCGHARPIIHGWAIPNVLMHFNSNVSFIASLWWTYTPHIDVLHCEIQCYQFAKALCYIALQVSSFTAILQNWNHYHGCNFRFSSNNLIWASYVHSKLPVQNSATPTLKWVVFALHMGMDACLQSAFACACHWWVHTLHLTPPLPLDNPLLHGKYTSSVEPSTWWRTNLGIQCNPTNTPTKKTQAWTGLHHCIC